MNAQPGTLVDFNLSPSQSQAYLSNCDLLGNGQDCIRLSAASGNNSVAISKNPINDLAVALSKTMGIIDAFLMPNSGFGTGGRGDASNTWGIFITRNNTAPAHNIGSTGRYSVFDDPNVVYAEEIYCVGGTCGGSGVSGTYNVLTYALRQSGSVSDTLQSEDTTTCGGSVGSCIMAIPATSGISGCFASPCKGNNITNTNAVYFNYTGSATTNNVCSISANVLLGAGCSWTCAAYGGTVTLTLGSSCAATNIIPPNPFGSGNFYLGVWSNIPSTLIEWEFAPGTVPALGGTTGMETTAFVPNPGGTSQPNIDTGGFFGPVIKALINIGVFILNALLAFVSFIAPALEAALTFLESLIQAILNFIGNALGFGNIGTTLFTMINAILTFFTNGSYGLPAFFGFFGTYFTNFLRYLQIDFQFLTPVFNIANAILIFGVNGIAQAFTIITIGLQMILFGYGTFIVFAYFLYTGDDGIGGLFTFLGTLEAISFKILNSIVVVTNLGLDFIVTMVSLVPKPMIQMAAVKIPRLPTVDSTASMTFPTLDFGEARNGNLLVYWLWCMGLWFLAWFETQNPALPGSIVMLDPALATNVRNLSAYLPLLQAATLVSGGLVLAWFCLLPMRLAGIDVTEAPLGASLGRRTGRGPSGVRISAGKKHLIGPAKRVQKERQLGKKEEREAKRAIEKTKKEIEAEKRSEELRKQEIARNPTGKDLRGPNLQ